MVAAYFLNSKKRDGVRFNVHYTSNRYEKTKRGICRFFLRFCKKTKHYIMYKLSGRFQRHDRSRTSFITLSVCTPAAMTTTVVHISPARPSVEHWTTRSAARIGMAPARGFLWTYTLSARWRNTNSHICVQKAVLTFKFDGFAFFFLPTILKMWNRLKTCNTTNQY